MAKKLTNILFAGILGGTILGLSNCATLPIERKVPEGHITGVEYKTLNQNEFPYIIEKQIIGNKSYYFQEAENIDGAPSIKIWRDCDVTRNLGVMSKEIKLTSKMDYYPTKVEEKGGTKDNFVDGIMLTTKGPYGIKAIIESTEQLAKKAGIPNNFGYKIITTEDGASFAIRTLKMPNGDGYFAPLVAEEKMVDKDKKKIPDFLDFYLIPFIDKEGNETIIKIDNICGNITLYNENDIYRPESFKHIKKRLENLGKEHKTIND